MNQLKEAFTRPPSSMQKAIRIKIDSLRDILIRAILDTLNEKFESYTPKEKDNTYFQTDLLLVKIEPDSMMAVLKNSIENR